MGTEFQITIKWKDRAKYEDRMFFGSLKEAQNYAESKKKTLGFPEKGTVMTVEEVKP